MDKQLKQLQPKKPLEKHSHKMSKESVLYIYRPEVNMTCQYCIFVEGKKCKIFGPDTDISPTTGTCGFFIHAHENKDIPYMGLITKDEAGYEENKTGFQCKRCHEFICGKMDCEKVDKDSRGDTPGLIHPNGCCNRWQKDTIRGNVNEEELNKLLQK